MSEKCFSGITDESSTMRRFHDTMISALWMIMCGDYIGTGFCIHQDGYILTAAHVLRDNLQGNRIFCKNMQTEKKRSAELVTSLEEWDMAVIKITSESKKITSESKKSKKFDYVKMADQTEHVFCGEDVFAIGNPEGLLRTFMFGNVAYSFEGYNLNKLPVNLNPEIVYKRNLSFDDEIQLHRTQGSVDVDQLSADIPLIQISEMGAVRGASGSAVFSRSGSVIGMLLSLSWSRQNYAIHFYALNRFLELVFADLKSKNGEAAKEK